MSPTDTIERPLNLFAGGNRYWIDCHRGLRGLRCPIHFARLPVCIASAAERVRLPSAQRSREAALEAQALAAAQSGTLDPFHQVETLGQLEIFDPTYQ